MLEGTIVNRCFSRRAWVKGENDIGLYISIVFGILSLINISADAIMISGDGVEIVFEKDEIPEGVIWSSGLELTKDGLVSTQASIGRPSETWLRSHRIPIGFSWRPPISATIELSVKGDAPDGFPLQAYIRYGCDGIHWSTWHQLSEDPKSDGSYLKVYRHNLQVPRFARRTYDERKKAWLQTEPNWSSDEDELCRWIARDNPYFFAQELPFIGYVQFLLEDWSLESRIEIRSLSASISSAVSGAATRPKSGSEAKEGRNWHFDLGEMLQEGVLESSLNPFGPEVWLTLPYEVMKSSKDAKIMIFDEPGELVRTIILDKRMRGDDSRIRSAFMFDGRDHGGRKLLSGPYFYSIFEGDGIESARRFVLK